MTKGERQEKRKAYMREYRQRSGVKQHYAEYRQRPEVRERRRECQRKRRQLPETKYKRWEYNQRPEVREKNAERARLCRQRMREADEITMLMQMKDKLQGMGYSAPPEDHKGN